MATPSYDDILQDLLANPGYDELFAAYQPQVREAFAKTYARQKYEWQRKGAQAVAAQEHDAGRFREQAYTRLWDIQRKKLFDLQCRWRAGQLTLPGVACTPDFNLLDLDIENCALLDSISPAEFEQYLDFVRLTPDFDEVLDRDYDWYNERNWQDYDGLKLYEREFDENTPDHMCQGTAPPAWYDFHNLRTGHGQLLSLPDLRGALEKPYREAYWDHRRAQAEAQQASKPAPTDPRPAHLPWQAERDLFDLLLEQFETPLLRRQKAAYDAQQAREAADEQVEEDIAYLKAFDAADDVPLAAAPNWRAALRQAVAESQRQQLLAHLPLVYDDYLMRQQLHIAHPQAPEPHRRDPRLYQGQREDLLDGRELLGEPRNFDF
jgi:hypothetical protein